eukprot:m.421658 g.421658  ORF g.421658 m.421658 type:complete len:919 (-) comp20198_c0_seq6:105-2861(-)
MSSSVAELKWLKVVAQGVTPYGAAIQVPLSFSAARLFYVRADGEQPFAVNAPQPFWVFGDAGSTATPGGHIRVFGKVLSLPPNQLTSNARLRLVSPATNLTLQAEEPDAGTTSPRDSLSRVSQHTNFDALFKVPALLPQGRYTLSVSNMADHEGQVFVPLCTFINETTPCLDSIDIGPRLFAPFKPDMFTVKAPQPGPGRSATAAVAAAIQAAANNGGGVVFFERGTYFVNGPIQVPPGVVLRGEAMHLVSIYFAEDTKASAPDAYVTSTEPGSWGVFNITLYVTAYFNAVVRTLPQTDGFHMANVRIRANSYFCHGASGGTSRGRTVDWPADVGVAVLLAGTNLFVSDSDLYSSGDVISTRDNSDIGATYMQIVNNTMHNGGTAHWGISWKQTIFELNAMRGCSITAMGSNYPQYTHNSIKSHVCNIWHGDNSYSLVFGGDREMMTLDGGGGVYYGPVEGPPATSGTQLKLAAEAQGTQPGGAVCVLAGKGTGQCRRIVSSPGAAAAGVAAQPATQSRPGTAPEPPVVSGQSVRLVPCTGASTHWRFDPSNGSTWHNVENNSLVLCANCDPPGRPSSSTACGTQPFPEPLVVFPEDSWMREYDTDGFDAPDPSTGHIRNKKGSKCLAPLCGDAGSSVTASSSSPPSSFSSFSSFSSSALLCLVDCDGAGDAAVWHVYTQSHQLLHNATGQCLGTTADASNAWQLDAPFDVPLDSTSHVTIMPYVGRILFGGNHYADGGAVQLYTQAIEVTLFNNTFERTGGLTAWGRQEETSYAWGANLMNEFVYNVVLEGNHVWNYNTQPAPPKVPGPEYYPGGSKTTEPWFFGSLTNDQGEPSEFGPPKAFTGAFNRFIVFRGNRVMNNGGLVVRGTSANVLVQHNTIELSDVGIYVNYTTTQGGIVLLDNQQPPNVPDNFNPYI